MVPVKDLGFEWGVAAAVLPGEAHSGDRYSVCAIPGGALFAVVDGLGHGGEAAAAAAVAVETIERNAHEPVITLLRRCHAALRSTRGAVISLAAVNLGDRMMTWIGVGNVAGVLLRASPRFRADTLLLRNGVVGAHLPPLQAEVLPVAVDDVLALATDGISGDFAQSISTDSPVQRIAEHTLARHGKGTDDALLLMARFSDGMP